MIARSSRSLQRNQVKGPLHVTPLLLGLQTDVPYNVRDKAVVLSFWKGATAHTGMREPRAKRGRPKKAEHERKEQIALRLHSDVVAWYRSLGDGWQTWMNCICLATDRDYRLEL